MRSLSMSFLVTAFLVWGVGQAKGGPITFIQTVANASGTLGGVPFNDVVLTFTSMADTTAVFQIQPLDYFVHTTSTVAVPGIGTATFTDPMYVFNHSTDQVSGFGDQAPGHSDILQEVGPAFFSTYKLDSSTVLFTLTDQTGGTASLSEATTLGGLIYSDPPQSTATFQATLGGIGGSTPEPSSLVLLSVAAAGVGLVAWRKRGSAAAAAR
jgi:hypothetical protein